MHQVRAPRTQHVAVPPAAPTALELSREEREQLRVVRHHAYHRYQRNASWMRELLISETSGGAIFNHHGHSHNDSSGAVGAANGVDKQREDSREVSAMKQHLEEQEKAFQADHQRHLEVVAALRAVDSEASLAACRMRVMEESALLAQTTKKELKTIKL